MQSLLTIFCKSLALPHSKISCLPQSGASERCFSWISSSLTHKHQTRLERPARGKHSSLLKNPQIMAVKRFIGLVLGALFGIFLVSNLRIFETSQSVCDWQSFSAKSNVCGQGKEEEIFKKFLLVNSPLCNLDTSTITIINNIFTSKTVQLTTRNGIYIYYKFLY